MQPLVNKVRFQWDGDLDSLREVELDYGQPRPVLPCQWTLAGCSVPPDRTVPSTPTITFTVNLHYDAFGRVSAIQYPDIDTSWRSATRGGRWATYTGTSGTAGAHKALSYEALL